MTNRFPLPRESTMHGRLLKFFSIQEFKKRKFRNIPDADVRSVFRIWALCFRDNPGQDERIPVERFLCAADFFVIQCGHEDGRLQWSHDGSSAPPTANAKERWHWIILVSQAILCGQYRKFFEEIMIRLSSPEFCVKIPTWNPEWIQDEMNK